MTAPTRYINLMCYVMVDKQGGIVFDRTEIAVSQEISKLQELEYFENMILQKHQGKMVRCTISTPPYLLRVEQLDTGETIESRV